MKKEKKLTEEMYHKYMKIINGHISNIEDAYKNLDEFKKISKLTFDEWKEWTNKGLRSWKNKK